MKDQSKMTPHVTLKAHGILKRSPFFRLPISELRTIWQLSDVSKDGGLSLEEFLTAMHLVVLRRNDIKLPETLPSCLCPLNLKKKLEPRIAILKQRQQEANLSDAANADTVSLGTSNKSLYMTFHKIILIIAVLPKKLPLQPRQ